MILVEHLLLRRDRLVDLSIAPRRQYSEAIALIVNHYRPPRRVKH